MLLEPLHLAGLKDTALLSCIWQIAPLDIKDSGCSLTAPLMPDSVPTRTTAGMKSQSAWAATLSSHSLLSSRHPPLLGTTSTCQVLCRMQGGLKDELRHGVCPQGEHPGLCLGHSVLASGFPPKRTICLYFPENQSFPKRDKSRCVSCTENRVWSLRLRVTRST